MPGRPEPKQTPSQTVGPYFALGLTPREYGYEYPSAIGPSTYDTGARGERIRLTGRVLDGEGAAIDDAMIEIWQADAEGRYCHPQAGQGEASRDPAFHGFARAGTGLHPDQAFELRTIKPGAGADGQAPHLVLVLFMRGGLNHLYTRVYFDDEQAANASDPVLSQVPAERRGTLLAQREETSDGVQYRFDIHMQGPRETVFFDV
ncbi:MAG TPA: protocatechuate 3,4-dioxygenase subunit alpha [Arenicellales bacterium]|nr:protocatechuate 3,4-dioxygenase subunit alpha [Arenicellales bacterium]